MNQDDLYKSLQHLTPRDVGQRASARIKRQALSILREQRELEANPRLGSAARLWRAAEPAFAALVVGLYLTWMIATLILTV